MFANKFTLIIAVMLLTSIKAISQKSGIGSAKISFYISETKDAMKALNINIRQNILLDSPLLILVDSSFVSLKARFEAQKGHFPLGGDTALRFYADPKIYLSKTLDSVLVNQKHLKNDFRIIAASILVHELVHYLQATYVKPQVINGRQLSNAEYFYSPPEYEAWLVQCYYFMKKHNPNAFRTLLKSNKSSTYKNDLFFDYFFSTKKKILLRYPVEASH